MLTTGETGEILSGMVPTSPDHAHSCKRLHFYSVFTTHKNLVMGPDLLILPVEDAATCGSKTRETPRPPKS
jgi:hypothetical protein